MIQGWLIPAVMVVQRLLELAVSRRNLRLALARGGREFHRGSFHVIALMHALFIASLLAESGALRLQADARTAALAAVLVLLQGIRYWCIVSLGENWNTRIVAVPGGRAVRKGPYLFLRHPNYLVVTAEFLLIPLLLRAFLTLAVFFPLNLIVLRSRIALEERVLAENTDYAGTFGTQAIPPTALMLQEGRIDRQTAEKRSEGPQASENARRRSATCLRAVALRRASVSFCSERQRSRLAQ